MCMSKLGTLDRGDAKNLRLMLRGNMPVLSSATKAKFTSAGEYIIEQLETYNEVYISLNEPDHPTSGSACTCDLW